MILYSIFFIAIAIISFFLIACGSIEFVEYIISPKLGYYFNQVDPPLPPLDNDKRLDAGDNFPQPIYFWMRSPTILETEYKILPVFFVQKPFQKCNLREIICEWDTGRKTIVKDKEIIVTEKDYQEKNGWYIIDDIDINVKIKFYRIFKRKKAGDEFGMKFIIFYFFDDDLEETYIIEYKCTVFNVKFTEILNRMIPS